MRRIINFYNKNKTKLIIALILFILLSLSLQLYLFDKERLTEEDLYFKDLSWSEFCDGTRYTEDDKEQFCRECLEQKGDYCDWPLDITLIIERVDSILRTGGEVHCFLIINDVNYYYEKGKFYGVINKTLFTWDILDATKGYHVQVCCGIERQSPIATLVGLQKQLSQACTEKEVKPRC